MIRIIAFDADDTLWHNETLFQLSHQKFEELLSGYKDKAWIKQKLFETEMRNLKYFGYGIKGFTLSMIETAIQMTDGEVTGKEIQTIINLAREMIEAPVVLLEHVRDTIESLHGNYPLMLITKGDIFDQESKIARSDLSDYFDPIEIVSTKTEDTYQSVFDKHAIDPGTVLMVGNSLKSDILPVLSIGGHAAFIPYPLCWEHEKIDTNQLDDLHYHELEHIGQLPALIEILNDSHS